MDSFAKGEGTLKKDLTDGKTVVFKENGTGTLSNVVMDIAGDKYVWLVD
jgi:alpha-glucuronidase